MTTETINECLVFTLDFQEKPVTIAGEDYVLVELDGKARDSYLNNVGGRMRVNAEGKPSGLKNFDGLQASLVAASLRKIIDGKQIQVKATTVQSWPAKVVSALFDAAKELSALGQEDGEDDAAEND